MAQALGIEVTTLDFGSAQSVDASQLEEALREDASHQYKAVITVQTDTSTSISNNIPNIRAAITAANHPALLMVDCIASFCCEPFDMDAWGVDVMLTASQKGLMTPPGLAIVYLGEKVWKHHEAADLNTPSRGLERIRATVSQRSSPRRSLHGCHNRQDSGRARAQTQAVDRREYRPYTGHRSQP